MENRKSTTFNFNGFKAFEAISSNLVKIFTLNKYNEFYGYNKIKKRLNIDICFEDSYSS